MTDRHRCLTIISANVCALRTVEANEAATLCPRAALEKGLSTEGIQEASARQGGFRTDLAWHMWASATTKGKRGCELWVSMAVVTEMASLFTLMSTLGVRLRFHGWTCSSRSKVVGPHKKRQL